MIKHFTATTYLLEPTHQFTLFLWHQKLHSWLPPGGHLEENETPEEAARREIYEEIGEKIISFLPNNKQSHPKIDSRTEFLLVPHFILAEQIEQDHIHLDMIFYAEIAKKTFLSPENHQLKWFSLKEIQQEKKIFEKVRILAIKGLSEL